MYSSDEFLLIKGMQIFALIYASVVNVTKKDFKCVYLLFHMTCLSSRKFAEKSLAPIPQ